MRGVECDRCQEWVYLLVEELYGELAIRFAEVFPAHDADANRLKFRDEAIIPAGVLVVGELMEALAEAIYALIRGESGFIGLLEQAHALFKLLQDSCDTDLDEFIEVAGGDGEELYSLEDWVGGIVGFFEDAVIELKPAFITIDETVFQKGLRQGDGALACCAG